jgi:hypothetical protein
MRHFPGRIEMADREESSGYWIRPIAIVASLGLAATVGFIAGERTQQFEKADIKDIPTCDSCELRVSQQLIHGQMTALPHTYDMGRLVTNLGSYVVGKIPQTLNTAFDSPVVGLPTTMPLSARWILYYDAGGGTYIPTHDVTPPLGIMP